MNMSGAHVFIDRSQFPDEVRRDLTDSLRKRAINHKFHYETHKQAAKWLALHEAHSPARTDTSCLSIYDQAFTLAGAHLTRARAHLIGLGCGGGQKEARLLEVLGAKGIETRYTASDVSLPLVLTALKSAPVDCQGETARAVVCDLATTTELADVLDAIDATTPRLLTLFGLIPNFEPRPLLSRVAKLLHAGDLLLLSANLAPGDDYPAGVEKVLPQYDNQLTHDWLMTLLQDLGFESEDGHLEFAIESDNDHLLRITANFAVRQARKIRVYGESFHFTSGDRLRVFFSYRHTVESIQGLLSEFGMRLRDHRVNDSGEEGVFLIEKR